MSYPFGMAMPGRTFSASREYRYGFNGKENDKDLSEGAIAFEARIYDGRIGRFLSTDPKEEEYCWQTPYAYFKNSPISVVDVLGEGGGDPPVKTTLFTNTTYSGAAGIQSGGFNATDYSKSGWNWFMTNSNGNSIGKTQASMPVQLEIKLDISKARKIPHSQWTGWYNEALEKLGFNRGGILPEAVERQAVAMRNEIAGEWMAKDGGSLYEITARQGGATTSGQRIIAARDAVVKGTTTMLKKGSALKVLLYSASKLVTTKAGLKVLGGGLARGILFEATIFALKENFKANAAFEENSKKYNTYEMYNQKYGTNYTEKQFNSLRSMGMGGGY